MKTPEQRFWEKVDRREANECWEWTGARMPQGYGLFGGKKYFGSNRAHRISWFLHHGPVPDGLFVCHHCDNPSCVNPAHLFVGNAADNIRDAINKGRFVPARHAIPPDHNGERNGRARLTSAQVLEIRKLGNESILTRGDIARKFNIHRNHLGRILRRRCWTDV